MLHHGDAARRQGTTLSRYVMHGIVWGGVVARARMRTRAGHHHGGGGVSRRLVGGACRAHAQRSAHLCPMMGSIAHGSAVCCADATCQPDVRRHRPAMRTGRGKGAGHVHDSARERGCHSARGDCRAHVRRPRQCLCHVRPWPRPALAIRGTGLASWPTRRGAACAASGYCTAARGAHAATYPCGIALVAPRAVPTPRATPMRIGPTPPHALAVARGHGSHTPRRESARATQHMAMSTHRGVCHACVKHARPWARPHLSSEAHAMRHDWRGGAWRVPRAATARRQGRAGRWENGGGGTAAGSEAGAPRPLRSPAHVFAACGAALRMAAIRAALTSWPRLCVSTPPRHRHRSRRRGVPHARHGARAQATRHVRRLSGTRASATHVCAVRAHGCAPRPPSRVQASQHDRHGGGRGVYCVLRLRGGRSAPRLWRGACSEAGLRDTGTCCPQVPCSCGSGLGLRACRGEGARRSAAAR